MTAHCPACRAATELRGHRDATAAEWSVRRATLNFAVIVVEQACPNWKPRSATAAHEPGVEMAAPVAAEEGDG